jgi:glycyl-tRNA synthetase beta chain
MGYYYALSGGKQEAIAVAIRDHYKPQGPGDSVPTGEAVVLALADKIDSLCGLMLAGEKPTGSKDPYAVRRLALGIIRIILENKLQQNIVKLVEFSCSLYSPFINYNSAEVHQIISFIEERAKNYFKEQFDNAQVSAVVNSQLEPDLLVTKWKLEALNSFLGTVAGEVLLNSYKRASNIIGSAKLNGQINPDLFDQQEEIQLMEFLTLNLADVDLLIEKKDFLESLKTLSSMNHVIANFFENVMVMDKNPEIANNRLLLLDKIRQLFNKVANFDLL